MATVPAVSAAISAAVSLAEWLRVTNDYALRNQIAACLVFVAAVYVRCTVRPTSNSAFKLLLAIPAILLNSWVPLLYDHRKEVLSRTTMTFALAWLANFKVLGICMRRGPLVADWTLPQFVVLYGLPVYPSSGSEAKGRLADSAGGTLDILKNILLNAGILAASIYALMTLDLPVSAKHYIYALGLCSFITIIMSVCASLLVALLDLQLVPPFDNPWFMRSLGDLWSRRWNNTTSLLLRALVYDPIEEGRLVKAPAGSSSSSKGQQAGQQGRQRTSRARQLVGMTATFAASGVMHEIILQYVVDQYRPFFWFTFFTIQAPLCAAEAAVHRALKAQGRPMPWYVSAAIANVLMLLTAKYFFFPPVEPTGLAALVVNSLASNFGQLVAWVRTTVPLTVMIGHMSAAA